MAWFASWRKFTFLPAEGTTFDVGCLSDVVAYINYLEADRKR